MPSNIETINEWAETKLAPYIKKFTAKPIHEITEKEYDLFLRMRKTLWMIRDEWREYKKETENLPF